MSITVTFECDVCGAVAVDITTVLPHGWTRRIPTTGEIIAVAIKDSTPVRDQHRCDMCTAAIASAVEAAIARLRGEGC